MGETARAATRDTRLPRLAEPAVQDPALGCTTLAHRIDVDLVREAYRRTRQDAAPGIDEVTAAAAAEPLAANLDDRHERRRRGLEKADGGQRPIGRPTFEDKLVQRAVARLVGASSAQDVPDGSDGVRDGRRPHQARQERREPCLEKHRRWIVDAAVRGGFESLDQGLVRDVIRKRVTDGGLLRLLGNWLHAGVVAGDWLTAPEQGTPHGGVRSPLVANVCLHEVLEAWYEREVRPRMKGGTCLSRVADDGAPRRRTGGFMN